MVWPVTYLDTANYFLSLDAIFKKYILTNANCHVLVSILTNSWRIVKSLFVTHFYAWAEYVCALPKYFSALG